MNDQLRLAIMVVITNTLALGSAFGLSMTGEQVGAITALGNSVLLLAMFFWKTGQGAGTALKLSLGLAVIAAALALAGSGPSPVQAQATATWTIIIMLDTDSGGVDGLGGEFDFDGDLGDFDLKDDEQEDFVVEAGDYTVEINLNPGWRLELVVCTHEEDVEEDLGDDRIEISLKAGQVQLCTFHVHADPTPTPTATSTPTPTPTLVPMATQAPVVQTVVVERTVVVTQQISPPRTGEVGLK